MPSDITTGPIPGRKNGRPFRPPTGNPMGAPSLPYDPDVAAAICQRVADGASVKALCATDEFPCWNTVKKWMASETDFAIRYAQARTLSAETLEYEAIEIADRPGLDPHDKRVRVDTRKWAAAKRNPRVYGDKLDLSVSGGLAIAPALDTSQLSLEELEVLERLLSKARRVAPITIENKRLGDIESPQSDS